MKEIEITKLSKKSKIKYVKAIYRSMAEVMDKGDVITGNAMTYHVEETLDNDGLDYMLVNFGNGWLSEDNDFRFAYEGFVN